MQLSLKQESKATHKFSKHERNLRYLKMPIMWEQITKHKRKLSQVINKTSNLMQPIKTTQITGILITTMMTNSKTITRLRLSSKGKLRLLTNRLRRKFSHSHPNSNRLKQLSNSNWHNWLKRMLKNLSSPCLKSQHRLHRLGWIQLAFCS
jgi:hypothetical protein